MGSTYDTDNESIVLSVVVTLFAHRQLSIKISNINLNMDDVDYQSIKSRNTKFTLISANYKQIFSYGQL